MLKKIIHWLHLWLGIGSGIVVLIVSLTGCIYVFSDELKETFYHDRFFIQPSEAAPMPISILREKAQEALGTEYQISRSEVYPAKDRSWIFRATETNPEGFGHWNYYTYYWRVYVNPYNGEILHIEDSRNEFFQLVLSTHLSLLLGDQIGGAIVGYSTLIFIFLLLSGLVLWWPKKMRINSFKRGLTIKWKASFRRFNYDLHNTAGFYILLPALVLAITGVVYSFAWVDQSVQYVFDGGKTVEKRQIPESIPTNEVVYDALDNSLIQVLQKHSTADLLSLRFRKGETAPIDIQVRFEKRKTHLFAWYYFDRNTGNLLMEYGSNTVKGGEKGRTMNFDLHVGSIGGMPTRILAFLISLVCASLPVTGFIIWYKRHKKRKERKPSRPKKTAVYST